MANGQRVLVVDGLAETAEVLKAVLEPRGLQVERVRRPLTEPADDVAPPRVVVLHEDSPSSGRSRDEPWRDVPRVIIGSVMFCPSASDATSGPEHHLQKPFHYRDLIAAIEDLLQNGEAPR